MWILWFKAFILDFKQLAEVKADAVKKRAEQKYLILGGGGTSARPRAAAADGGKACRGDKGVFKNATETHERNIFKCNVGS